MPGRLHPILALSVTLFALVLARGADAPAQDKVARAKGIALHVCIMLNEQAGRMEREGRPAGSLAKALALKAGLNNTETTALQTVALRMGSQVAPLDQRARELIQEARQKYPGGRLAPGTPSPTPPAELAVLQRQRDTIVAQAVLELDRELGSAGVAKLVDYMNKAETSNSLRSLPVRMPNQIGPAGNPVRPISPEKELER